MKGVTDWTEAAEEDGADDRSQKFTGEFRRGGRERE